jgi:hypothetical protein
MWCTIVPKVEVHIKVGGYDSSKLVDLKTDIFGEDRETEVVVAKKFHMKNPKLYHPDRIAMRAQLNLQSDEREIS